MSKRSDLARQARTRKSAIKRRRDGSYEVVVPCVGSRKNAERAKRMVDNYLLAHRQYCRDGVGGVRLNELSDVLFYLGLCVNMRLVTPPASPPEPPALPTGDSDT